MDKFLKVGLALTAIGITALAALVCLEEEPELQPAKKGNIVPGDFVQWESQGIYVFQSPKKVTDVRNFEGNLFVFVENCSTGIPIDQIVKI